MKRMASILIALLLIAAPSALAEPSFSPFDHRTGQSGGGRYLYYDFPDVSLDLPMEWKGRITVEQADDGIAFYQTASLERYAAEGVSGGGLLFRLCACADERFRDLPACAYLGWSESAGLHFYLELPSDYAAYPDDAVRAEYDGMADQIDTVAAMARIRPSLSFHTEGLESTDAGMS